MASRFEKVSIAPLFDFDGFDAKAPYQMVPVGQVREMSVVTDDDECTIVVDPQNIAKMQNFVFDKPLLEVPREFRAKVTPRNRIKFQLNGLKRGNTTLLLVDRTGKVVSTLLVSVKGVVSKTVSLVLLSDMKRDCPFTEAELPALLENVKKTYKQQANLELNQVGGTAFPVNVKANLGNPIIPDNKKTRLAIIEATPQPALAADFVVYFTWDIFSQSRGQVIGANLGFDCYAEHQANPFDNAINVAHELGHALGLTHTTAKTMMAGDGNTRTSKLQQFEIDVINQTDA